MPKMYVQADQVNTSMTRTTMPVRCVRCYELFKIKNGGLVRKTVECVFHDDKFIFMPTSFV